MAGDTLAYVGSGSKTALFDHSDEHRHSSQLVHDCIPTGSE